MAEYEVVREIQNLCRNNQMRDVFFIEVETRDPETYVRSILGEDIVSMSREERSDGSVTLYVSTTGLTQKFVFTPI